MPTFSDPQFILALAATLLTIVAFVFYFRDLFRRRTQPHMYTWLVWTLTQGTAAYVATQSGGGFGAKSLMIGTALIGLVFIFSFKYGTKHRDKTDTFVLVLALAGVIAWWQLKQPLLAVIMACVIDSLGYTPTFRKTYAEPWSETPAFWLLMSAAMILTIFASNEYNFLTGAYATLLAVANAAIFLIAVIRRKKSPLCFTEKSDVLASTR